MLDYQNDKFHSGIVRLLGHIGFFEGELFVDFEKLFSQDILKLE